MERIYYNSLRFTEFLDNLNPRNSGIILSFALHLLILLFAVGLPNFFGPKDIFVPNIIPIEILNVSDTTNIEKLDAQKNNDKITPSEMKKFNSSENLEVQKNFDIKENIKNIKDNNQPSIVVKQKNKSIIEEKKKYRN